MNAHFPYASTNYNASKIFVVIVAVLIQTPKQEAHQSTILTDREWKGQGHKGVKGDGLNGHNCYTDSTSILILE